MEGTKTWEIRGKRAKKAGQVIYLAGSGTFAIYARVKFEACHGPLTQNEWDANLGRHCVMQHTRAYGARTYAYQFGELEVARYPIPFKRNSAVVFQNVPIGHAELTNAMFEAPLRSVGRVGGSPAISRISRGPGLGGHWCVKRIVPRGAEAEWREWREWRHGDAPWL